MPFERHRIRTEMGAFVRRGVSGFEPATGVFVVALAEGASMVEARRLGCPGPRLGAFHSPQKQLPKLPGNNAPNASRPRRAGSLAYAEAIPVIPHAGRCSRTIGVPER